MLAKADLQQLAEMRFEDAVTLLRAKRASAAYYLAGYSVELALKACISKLIRPDTIPDKAFINAIYTHKFDNLVSTAGLRGQLDSNLKANPDFAANWAISSNWTEESRYQFWDPIAAATLLTAIGDPTNGVLEWVKRHW